jgi:hypothetical protein
MMSPNRHPRGGSVFRRNTGSTFRRNLHHDMTVLAEVRRLRSSARTSLEARALLLTCDYWLYRFDWELSRSEGRLACTVLPNLLWQVIRPLIPQDVDFDRSFAETFALPEFRSVRGQSSNAHTKMMGMLASYDGLPEETASRLLSNDLLLEQLRTSEDDNLCQQYIDSAIAHENTILIEERVSLQLKLERDRAEARVKEEQMQEEIERLRRHADRLSADAKASSSRLADERQETEVVVETLQRDIGQAREARLTAGREAKAAMSRAENAEAKLATILSCVVSVVGCSLIFGITHLLPWPWLRDHQNAYALQAAMCAAIIVASLALFRKAHRTKFLQLLFPVALLVIKLLGGSRTPPSSLP